MFSVKTSWKNIIPPILNQPSPSPPPLFLQKNFTPLLPYFIMTPSQFMKI